MRPTIPVYERPTIPVYERRQQSVSIHSLSYYYRQQETLLRTAQDCEYCAQSREIELLVQALQLGSESGGKQCGPFGAFLRRESESWYYGGTSRWTEVEGTRGDLLLSLQSRQLASAMPVFPLPSRLRLSEQASCGFSGGANLQLTQEANKYSFCLLCKQRVWLLGVVEGVSSG